MTNKRIISKYRTELMGLSAIMILVVHSVGFVEWPAIINKVFSYGGVGVYSFVYLSALGLSYSMRMNKSTPPAKFYRKRLSRILTPYFLIYGPWLFIKYIVFEHDIVVFLYEFSLLRFWFEHKGAWFLAMIIVVYLAFPFYYRWLNNGKCGLKTIIAVWCIAGCSIVLNWFKPDIFRHLAQVLNSFLFFEIACYIVWDEEREMKRLRVFGSALLVLYVLRPYRYISVWAISNYLSGVAWSGLGIVVMIFAAYILDLMSIGKEHNMLTFCGKHSLELYLWNTALVNVAQYFELPLKLKFAWHSYSSLVVYIGIIVGGFVLSYFTGKLRLKFLGSAK